MQMGPLQPAAPGALHRPPRPGRAAAPGLARRALQRAPAPLPQRRRPLVAGQAPDWALAPAQAPLPHCLGACGGARGGPDVGLGAASGIAEAEELAASDGRGATRLLDPNPAAGAPAGVPAAA